MLRKIKNCSSTEWNTLWMLDLERLKGMKLENEQKITSSGWWVTDKSIMDRWVWGILVKEESECETRGKWMDSWHLLSSVNEVWYWGGRLTQSARNKKCYHSISQRHAIPCGQHLISSNFIMLQYKDSKCTSVLCKTYLGKKMRARVLSLDLPALSPDLNPTEVLWDKLKCKVREKCPTSQSHLWEVPQNVWVEFFPEYL